MDILVDTHILIWVLSEQNQLSAKRRDLLKDFANNVFVSQVSLMELTIKKNLNKLPHFVPAINVVAERWLDHGYEILELTNQQIFALERLPLFPEHRDPFDRFIVAVALQEGMAVMSDDKKFRFYDSIIPLI